MRMHGLFISILLAAGSLSASTDTAAGLTAKEIVSRGQELLRGSKSSHAKSTLKIIRPSFEKNLEVESFHEGRDKSFLIVHRPPEDAGSRTLRLKQNVWTYTRKTEHPIKIPYSMMHTSWMGSDFTYEDIVKLDSLVTEYEHKILERKPDPQERLPGFQYVLIHLIPKEEAPVVWGWVYWSALVSKDGKEVIPIEEQDFNERGELIRMITLENIKPMDGRRVPTLITCQQMSDKKAGHRTVLEYQKIDFDPDLPAKTFTMQALQRGIR